MDDLRLTDEEQEHVRADNLILAIKSVRERLRCGLVDAKNLVESEARKLGWKPHSEREARPCVWYGCNSFATHTITMPNGKPGVICTEHKGVLRIMLRGV